MAEKPKIIKKELTLEATLKVFPDFSGYLRYCNIVPEKRMQ